MPRINKHALWSGCICVAVILMVSGCGATVAMMPETLDVEAKRFSPPPDKANIYVVRISSVGASQLVQIYLDGKIVASIASGTYLLFEVDPGTNQVGFLTWGGQDVVTLDTKGGKNYFVDVSGNGLEELNQEEAREAVEGTKRAQPLGWRPTP